MSERYRAEVKAQAAHYARVSREDMRRTLRKIWRLYRSMLYCIAVPTLCAVLFYTFDPSLVDSRNATFPLICLLFAAYMAFYALIVLVRWLKWWRKSLVRLRKIISDPEVLAQLDYTLEFDDEELLCVSNRELHQIHWETFDSIELTPITLYLERYGQVWAMFSREALGEDIFQAMVRIATAAQQRKLENKEE